ncbi:MAG: S-layer homology domain-containing protein [Pleurocapsa sp.]
MLLNRISKKITWSIACSALLGLLASCGTSATWENLVSADPQLKNKLNYQPTNNESEVNPKALDRQIFASDSDTDSDTNISQSPSDNKSQDETTENTQPKSTSQVTLPDDFPQVLPLYPQAELDEVEPGLTATQGLTLWRSQDTPDQLISYYRQELEANDWQIIQPFTLNDEKTQLQAIAIKDDLEINLAIAKLTNKNSKLTLSYQPAPQDIAEVKTESTDEVAQTPDTEKDSAIVDSEVTQDDFSSTDTQPKNFTAKDFSDFDETPEQLRKYVKDVANLGILTSYAQNGNPGLDNFAPNEPISRGEYARWLIAANNLYYSDSPGNKIHVPNQSELPAFKDINPQEPGFGAIQGLAEAGLIPSMLTDDSSKLLFQPNAPLKREDLIAWKVPLDLRKALPPASAQAIKDSWGFQDVASIDPAIFKALFGDFQNGDRSNIKRIFGYTTLFQPKKPVTRAEAAASLWYFGFQGDGITAPEASSLNLEQ